VTVTGRRTFDEHVALLVSYGARVAQLTPGSWERLRRRCAGLNGPEFGSLVRRALLAARPYEMWLPSRPTASVRAISGASRVVQTGLAFAFEVAAAFDVSDSRGIPSRPLRARSTGKPTTDAFIDAWFSINSALTPFQQTDRGLVTVVRAAGQAILRHGFLSPVDFDAVYGFVEPEIPFATLEMSSNGTRSG
jgi:hypothetical protein